RDVVTSLGGVANGFPRQTGFDITVASEVMAIFCLATGPEDLARRLGNIVVGETRDRRPVRAADLKADGPMAVLLKDAMQPNLVQTLENNPAFIHGGPFANIAHGCNSVVATKTALKLANYVVTEAGFGADLGAEKFFNIKCRKTGLAPAAAVVVATVRALKMHGGVAKEDLGQENVAAVAAGLANLARHVENVQRFGVPVVVAINRFSADTDAELAAVQAAVGELGVAAIEANHWAEGSAGTAELAEHVVALADGGAAAFKPLYDDAVDLFAKIETIAREIYGAGEVTADSRVRAQLRQWEEAGHGHFPVCMAKTQYSFSTNPALKGAPKGHSLPVREVRLSAGAEFVVAICGEIMTMPGLPRVPAANNIRIDADGRIDGLF
ncbi:MAG: formate--tetrahydrofolate ligase, partial [Pseudomonadota bacterium]|nr:formate--tetrahydrofolate ligase [Pseudomonadota bacterium]